MRLTGKKGARNVGEQIIDANAMPVWAEAVEKWRNSEPLSYQCLVYPPDEVPKVMSILNEVISTMPEEARISAADFPEGLYSCEGQNKFGNLGFNHSRPPTEEEYRLLCDSQGSLNGSINVSLIWKKRKPRQGKLLSKLHWKE
ncbi:MAG: hypothetical protein U5K79_16495 [Cyclobacteriaceae bacterium]|nr:hypothetical protein [Cyclobacteriaceae bacterium]